MVLPVFSADKISVRFLNNVLFSNLNFHITKGQSWALTGESGSGKSALLQTIAGNFNITGGEIRYHFFEDYLQQHPDNPGHFTHHQLIALVEAKHHFKNLSNTGDFYYQQRYNSSDSEDALTVEAYLHTIKPAPQPNIYWHFDKIITTLKLDQLSKKELIKLSNGETKRLRIAAALMKNPVLLLLDSPLTGLDVQTRQEFNAIITEITASGITVVMATSPYEIPDSITNVAVLKNGVITHTVGKADFTPQLVEQYQADNIDKAELSSLLHTNNSVHDYRKIISMNKVHVKYGTNVILNDIDWQVNPGDRWALLGHNGAGKSTLLSLINGDNPQAYANDIILFDKKRGSGESIWDIKKKIGFVSPELHQYFPVDNSCLQVIESGYYDTLGLFRPGSKEKAEVALRWMKALEIDKYARVLLKNIPASAQRLCLLARALIKNPPLLIFDEPCQGMDSHQQQHFKNLVDTICSLSKVTLIYVTHYQHEIPESVDKVLKLEKGHVVN
ncbi:ATP-binding cassette domain-containing protein [Mucilaginibacter sp. UR6-11]|uniref:ATP-binding cassette domain-containing protein n=1 Tax=Mucilaginibacter sp. UR6-11 TaxID=1435644 RepID=UPI001E37C214|nr:ATP-binding cassette domain-containing protein [Mucilaginibacter sp. UR6-11]MCC8423392.1 ATP-binding cassette domain-containing protein [Mucilaginibacter sp. UR6-11]